VDPAPDTEITLVEVEGLLPGASNATLLAHDASGRPWVYKPARGERPLWDFPTGTLGLREIASYRISQEFGLDVVPLTLRAEGPYGPGSAQEFLHEDFGWDPRPLIVGADPSLWPVVVVDLLANNADRKIGHLLREPGEEHVWAIDNGLTFHIDDKLRTVMWSFAGTEIPAEIVARLDPESAGKAVADLLEGAEVEALAKRVESVRNHPVHPSPPDHRPPLPWPVW
jgi:hypothetical protein